MPSITDLADAYEDTGKYDVDDVSEQWNYIEFNRYSTNYRNLGDIAHENGFVITAWNPDNVPKRLYFHPIRERIVGNEDVDLDELSGADIDVDDGDDEDESTISITDVCVEEGESDGESDLPKFGAWQMRDEVYSGPFGAVYLDHDDDPWVEMPDGNDHTPFLTDSDRTDDLRAAVDPSSCGVDWPVEAEPVDDVTFETVGMEYRLADAVYVDTDGDLWIHDPKAERHRVTDDVARVPIVSNRRDAIIAWLEDDIEYPDEDELPTFGDWQMEEVIDDTMAATTYLDGDGDVWIERSDYGGAAVIRGDRLDALRSEVAAMPSDSVTLNPVDDVTFFGTEMLYEIDIWGSTDLYLDVDGDVWVDVDSYEGADAAVLAQRDVADILHLVDE